jgi:hypothetical protein
MLKKVDGEAAHCYERAKDCAERAREARNEGIKADFIDLEARWLALAQSYELSAPSVSFAREVALRKHPSSLAAKHGLNPCETGVLRDAFDSVLLDLGWDMKRPETSVIASLIIEMADEGERDPERLKNLALERYSSRVQRS